MPAQRNGRYHGLKLSSYIGFQARPGSKAHAMNDQDGSIDSAARGVRNVARRGFLVAAGSAAAAGAGAAFSSPAVAQSPTVPAQPAPPVADLILKNGRVITVDGPFTIASAIAIAGSRILAVGTDEAITSHRGAATRVIDLEGRAVIPGITDGHAHMDREALRNVFPSLGRVRSIADIQARIAALARSKAPGEWIVTMPIGDPPYYFDVPEILAEKRWPTRQELDAAAPRNPVYIRAI